MRIDIDRYREILDTLSRNKSRTFLTGFGVFWGVFMLVALIGGGNGMKEMLSDNFEGFATNSALIWAQPTTKPYAGMRKGRNWCMSYRDVERLREQVPELDIVTPMVSRWGCNAVKGDKKKSCTMKGLTPEYADVETPKLRYGRYINEMDIQLHRKVCVIGKHVYKDLFPQGGDPCGQSIRIDQSYYHVVGVDYSSGNISINGNAEDAVSLPLTLLQQTYNLGDSVHIGGNRRIFVGVGTVVATYVCEYEVVAVLPEVEGQALDDGFVLAEAHVREPAEAYGQLVHEAAGLSEPVSLHALGHLRRLDRTYRPSGPEGFHRTAERELVGGRGRQAATRGDVARHDQVEAAGLASRGHHLGSHASYQRIRAHLLVCARV